jgi:Uma2 family endonuclease
MPLSESPTETDGPYRWRDFLALADDDKRELIDGHLLEIEMPTEIHEWIVATLARLLGNWAITRQAGIVLASGYKVRITDRRGVMPDVQFFRSQGCPLQNEGLEEGTPDLAVEIISPSSGRYDRVKKLAWYASIHTAEYWIIDPPKQRSRGTCWARTAASGRPRSSKPRRSSARRPSLASTYRWGSSGRSRHGSLDSEADQDA